MTDHRVSDERRAEWKARSEKKLGLIKGTNLPSSFMAISPREMLDLLADSDDAWKEIERLSLALEGADKIQNDTQKHWLRDQVRIEEANATISRLTAERDEAIANCAAKDRVISGATQMEDNYRARIADLEAQLAKEQARYFDCQEEVTALQICLNEQIEKNR